MRKPVWTDEKLKAGFDRFFHKHNRLPRAHEIDALPDLPSARAIQKRYGGLVALRERLGYEDITFAAGSNRCLIAQTAWARSRTCKQNMYEILTEYFGEPVVQREFVFDGRHRIAFYVTTNIGNFGVDIFFPATVRTMQSSINIKLKKYQFFTEPLYLVMANPKISQKELDTYSGRRKEPFAETISLLTMKKCVTEIKKIITPEQFGKPYSSPN